MVTAVTADAHPSAARGAGDGVTTRIEARETAAGAAVVLTMADVLDQLAPATVAGRIEVVLEHLEAVLSTRPDVVIADLGQAQPSRLVVGLLGIMRRRAARAGAALVLVDPRSALRAALDEAKVSALYTTSPSVAHALRTLGAPHRHPEAGRARPTAEGDTRLAG